MCRPGCQRAACEPAADLDTATCCPLAGRLENQSWQGRRWEELPDPALHTRMDSSGVSASSRFSSSSKSLSDSDRHQAWASAKMTSTLLASCGRRETSSWADSTEVR